MATQKFKLINKYVSCAISITMVASMLLSNGIAIADTEGNPNTVTTTLEDFETPNTTFFQVGADNGNLPLTLTDVDTTQNAVYKAVSGTHSLEADYNNGGDGYLKINDGSSLGINAGDTVTYNVYIPSGANVTGLYMFCMDKSYGGWTDKTFTIPETDKWAHISFTIPSTYQKPVGQIGLKISTTGKGYIFLDKIEKTSVQSSGTKTAPTASAVSIAGGTYVGNTLIGSYLYADAENDKEGATKFEWLRSASANGNYDVIPGATSLKYTLTRDDINKYIKLAVTPVSTEEPTTGSEVYSAPSAPVIDNVLPVSGTNLQPGYNNIKSVVIFDKTKADGTDFWSWGGIETKPCKKGWSFLPVVTDDVYSDNGEPSIELHQTGSWSGGIAFNGWGAIDFSSYYTNGSLEFNAAGLKGGESFAVGFDNNDSSQKTIAIPQDAVIGSQTAATKWQHYSIPLKQLMTSDKLNCTQLKFASADTSKEMNIYLNDIKVVTPDSEQEYPYIKVNQLGYFSELQKNAVVSGFNEKLYNIQDGTDFNLISADTKQTVYSGKLKLKTDYDYLSGEKVLYADFTSYKTPGSYYITVNGLTTPSYTFKIGNDIYNQLLDDVQKYYYYQRSGTDLDPKYAGQFAHKAFFMGDNARPNVNYEHAQLASTVGLSVDKAVYMNVPKGWFDAGDYSKDVDNGDYTVKKLLYAFEQFPSLFTDATNIPESGNGIPDILDNVKWETDFFLSMQDQSTGGFYNAVLSKGGGSANTDPFKPDLKDSKGNYYNGFTTEVFDIGANGESNVKSTATTGYTVSALAQAAYVFQKYDPAYSGKLLEAALKGWKYLQNNPNVINLKAGYSPYMTNDDDKSARVSAASALFRATGLKQFNNYVLAHYKDYLGKVATGVSATTEDIEADLHIFKNDYFNEPWQGESLALPLYDYITAAGADPQVKAFIQQQYKGYGSAEENRALNTVWQNTTNGDFYWGANSSAETQVSSHLDIFDKLFGVYSGETRNALSNNMNYILGINPLSFSFVSGEGTNSVKHIFGNTMMSDSVDGCPSGFMPDGVNRYNASALSNFPGKCYQDNGSSWVVNEHAVNYTGNLVYAIAAAIGAASDNGLSSLTISAGNVDNQFSKNTNAYTVNVDSSVSSIDITPTVADSTYSVSVNGVNQVSGTPIHVNLTDGANTVTILVNKGNVSSAITVTINRTVPYTLTDIKLTDINGKVIDKPAPGAFVRAVGTLQGQSSDVTFITALYSGDTLLNISTSNVFVEKGQQYVLGGGFNIPSDLTNLKIKEFVWDGIGEGEMNSLVNPVTVFDSNNK